MRWQKKIKPNGMPRDCLIKSPVRSIKKNMKLPNHRNTRMYLDIPLLSWQKKMKKYWHYSCHAFRLFIKIYDGENA